MNRPAFEAVAAHVLRRAVHLDEATGLVCVVIDQLDQPVRSTALTRSRPSPLELAVKILAEETRAEDVLARTAPNELSALLPGATEEDVCLVAGRLQDLFSLASAVAEAVADVVEPSPATGAESPGSPLKDAPRAGIGWAVATYPSGAGGSEVRAMLRVARARAS